MIGKLERIGVLALPFVLGLFGVYRAGGRHRALKTRAKELETSNDMLSRMARERPFDSADDAFERLRARYANRHRKDGG